VVCRRRPTQTETPIAATEEFSNEQQKAANGKISEAVKLVAYRHSLEHSNKHAFLRKTIGAGEGRKVVCHRRPPETETTMSNCGSGIPAAGQRLEASSTFPEHKYLGLADTIFHINILTHESRSPLSRQPNAGGE
jgi:hypothetical protein